jgi:gag-polyprotein putative aspartyl protease
MRAADESRRLCYATLEPMKPLAFRAFALSLSLGASAMAILAATRGVWASTPTIISSGSSATRTTIPITIDGLRTSCVLDTGTSAIIVSPWVAATTRLEARAGTFEVSPDGRTYVDRQTEIARLGVASYTLHDVPALISENVSGVNALCGYDFFAHFPTLIDRDRHQVTLFPPASRIKKMHCAAVDLASHVPLATVEINDTWVSHVVLDSGMAGGGALWEGTRSELRRPLVANADYETMPAAISEGFACGAIASIRYAPGAPKSSMPICTEPQRPDGDNGIIETNLSTVHAMAVDYPHRHICFDVNGYSDVATRSYPVSSGNPPSGAWARFNYYRPPN